MLSPAPVNGIGCSLSASKETPINNPPRLIAIQKRVLAAFFATGFLNACTPLLIASTPVNATAPEEKALSKTKSVTAPPVNARFCCLANISR